MENENMVWLIGTSADLQEFSSKIHLLPLILIR